MQFFDQKGFARYKKANGETDRPKLESDYKAHMDSIRHRLSPAWQQLAEEDFHDEEIVSVEQPSKHDFVLAHDEIRIIADEVEIQKPEH